MLAGHDFHELPIEGLSFPRQFVLVLPRLGEPAENVSSLAELLSEAATAHEPVGAGR